MAQTSRDCLGSVLVSELFRASSLESFPICLPFPGFWPFIMSTVFPRFLWAARSLFCKLLLYWSSQNWFQFFCNWPPRPVQGPPELSSLRETEFLIPFIWTQWCFLFQWSGSWIREAPRPPASTCHPAPKSPPQHLRYHYPIHSRDQQLISLLGYWLHC